MIQDKRVYIETENNVSDISDLIRNDVNSVDIVELTANKFNEKLCFLNYPDRKANSNLRSSTRINQ